MALNQKKHLPSLSEWLVILFLLVLIGGQAFYFFGTEIRAQIFPKQEKTKNEKPPEKSSPESKEMDKNTDEETPPTAEDKSEKASVKKNNDPIQNNNKQTPQTDEKVKS